MVPSGMHCSRRPASGTSAFLHLACWDPALRLGPEVGKRNPPHCFMSQSGRAEKLPGSHLLKRARVPLPRKMGTPVFEEQPASLEYTAALPLKPPAALADTQGLQLATNGDVLIGRADNGVILSLPLENF